MDAIYPCILGEINRLHSLDILMEKWKDTARIQRLERELEACRVQKVMDMVSRDFDNYYDEHEDYQETIIGIAYCLKCKGLPFFLKHRHECFDPDSNHDIDMFTEACTLVVMAEVHGLILEEVPLTWYMEGIEELA